MGQKTPLILMTLLSYCVWRDEVGSECGFTHLFVLIVMHLIQVNLENTSFFASFHLIIIIKPNLIYKTVSVLNNTILGSDLIFMKV